MKKILIIDDEKDIIMLLKDFLEIENFEVIFTTKPEEAMDLLTDDVSIVVLDINMPGISGIQLCKDIRRVSKVPVLFISCNSSQSDKLLGLGVGADDYITKPFDPIELIARIKANIRRSENFSTSEKNVVCFDDITLYMNNYKLFKGDKEINISGKEFVLLTFFIKNAHIVLSRDKILTEVWGNDYYNENVVNTTIKRLRDKLKSQSGKTYIKTIWSVGYMFEADVKYVE
ncbi:MAG: response regulator transcription factor [Firmicutes bacterium]|jgi:DNA-binding response OmpR family regulator|nr:response regulator transcription factor [Bacillota bacterium]